MSATDAQGENRTPGVSVVIPTHPGRERALGELLQSLDRARTRVDVPTEVLVVDSDSSPHEALSRALCERHDARYLTGGNLGAIKRNIGAFASRYDQIVFIDSDCVAHEDFLRAHRAAMTDGGDQVYGVVGLTRFVGPGGRIWYLAGNSGPHNSCFEWPLSYERVLWGATANFSVRASAFLEVGGFDESAWTVVGGEDVQLGVDLNELGGSLVTSPSAVALHRRDELTPKALFRSLWRYGACDTYLCTKFPHRRGLSVSPIVGIPILTLASGVFRRRWFMAWTASTAVCVFIVRDYTIQRIRSHEVATVRSTWGIQDDGREPLELVSEPVPTPLGHDAPIQRPTRWRDLATSLVDRVFDIGAASSAIKYRRPDLLVRRFIYIDDASTARRSR